MKKFFKILFYILLAAGISWGGWKLAGVLGILPKTAEQFKDDVWLTMSRIDPEGFTVFGVPPTEEALRLPGTDDPFAFLSELNDPRKEARSNKVKMVSALLEELQGFDPKAYPGLADLEQNLRSFSAPLPYPMADILAIQSGELYRTPFLMCYAHPVRNPSHAEAYIERLRALGSKATVWSKRIKGEVIGNEQVPPEAVQAAAAFCNRFTSIPVLKHPLYISFARRMARKGEVRVPQDEALKMLDRVASLLEDRVIPEWRELGRSLAQQPPSAITNLEKGLTKELGEDFTGDLDSLEQSILAFADSLRQDLNNIEANEAKSWLRNSAEQEQPWLDSLQLLVDVIQEKSAGLFQDLPAFRSLELKVQDSLFQVLGLPYWYLPADEAGHRKARLYIHPQYLGYASGAARTWLIQAAIPGTHTRFTKRGGRVLPIDAKGCGFGLYGGIIAGEIGLNTFGEGSIPSFAEGKASTIQLQLLACELALQDLGSDSVLSALPNTIKAPLQTLSLSRPGYALASWLEFQTILKQRVEAKKRDGNLFYLAKFNESLMQ